MLCPELTNFSHRGKILAHLYIHIFIVIHLSFVFNFLCFHLVIIKFNFSGKLTYLRYGDVKRVYACTEISNKVNEVRLTNKG